MTSKRFPKISKTAPITIDIFKYLVTSISLGIVWDKINSNPKRPKNMMSFPFDDPIKNKWVIGLMMGFSKSVAKITPPSNMNINPTKIVLLSFINNNLIFMI